MCPNNNIRDLRLSFIPAEARRFDRVCNLSDNFEMLVDAKVTLGQADMVKQRVLAVLHQHELIVREADNECDWVTWDTAPDRPFINSTNWQRTSFHSGTKSLAEWNSGSAVISIIGRTAPRARAIHALFAARHSQPDDEALAEVLSEAIGEWIEQSGPALVSVPSCRAKCPCRNGAARRHWVLATCRSSSGTGRRLTSRFLANRHPRAHPPRNPSPPDPHLRPRLKGLRPLKQPHQQIRRSSLPAQTRSPTPFLRFDTAWPGGLPLSHRHNRDSVIG